MYLYVYVLRRLRSPSDTCSTYSTSTYCVFRIYIFTSYRRKVILLCDFALHVLVVILCEHASLTYVYILYDTGAALHAERTDDGATLKLCTSRSAYLIVQPDRTTVHFRAVHFDGPRIRFRSATVRI